MVKVRQITSIEREQLSSRFFMSIGNTDMERRTHNIPKKAAIFALLVITSFSCIAQDTITVMESTFKLKGNSEESFYYGFAEGDKMIITLEEVKGKAIKEFEITESPSTSKFMDINKAKINKEMPIPRTAVYEFRIKTAFMAPRTCRMKLLRVPKDETTVSFNTAWEWKTVYDTAYIPYTIDSITGYDTIYYKETVTELASTDLSEVMVLDENAVVGAQMSLSGTGQHYQKRFKLPDNYYSKYLKQEMVSWAYWIGVGEEANQAWQRGMNAVKGLAETAAATYISPLGAAALGVAFDWAMPSTGENVQFSIVNGFGNTISQGNCISTHKTITNSYNHGEYVINLYNDNVMHKINVRLRVVAIIRTSNYHDVVYNHRKIDARKVTLNKTRMEVTPRQIRVNVQ